MKKVVVVGLGYVGLPLAVQAASRGYSVVGVDLNTGLVARVNDRKSPYVNDKRFESAFSKVGKDKLVAINEFDDIKAADVVVICVPTPTENNIPDLRFVVEATTQVARQLTPGTLVLLESTVSPGVTRDIVLPIIEKESSLIVGKDFHLAHCPERIDPGNEEFYVGNLNRVVGGITPECTKQAVEFYASIIDARIIALGSPEEAEFVKSWENSQRNVMIALANSAAIICDALDMDISRVLEGLQSKVDQFGLALAQPGLGPGGHCIPEDIHYVIKRARESGIDTRFLDDAAELNDRMPRYAIQRLAKILKKDGLDIKNTKVALLGMAYKPDIADLRRSPSIEVGHMLVRHAGEVMIHDPYIQPGAESLIKGAKTADSLEAAIKFADVVFLATAHSEYKQKLTPRLLNDHGIVYIFDGRNALDKAAFLDAGIVYKGIGR